MNTSLAMTEAMYKLTICLHNFMTRNRYCDSFVNRVNCNNIMANIVRENIPQTGAIRNYQNISPNNYSRQAEIRDRFTEYFMTEEAGNKKCNK